MRSVTKAIWSRTIVVLAMLSFIAGLLGAGSTYFFCRMTDSVQQTCCCAAKKTERETSVQRVDCCEARLRNALGNAVEPQPAPALVVVALPPTLGAPVAMASPRDVHIRRVLPRWTGPPDHARQAMLSVFLL